MQQQPTSLVRCHRRHIVQRAEQRGWLIEEVRGCIVEENGDTCVIDTSHPDYPSKARPPEPGASGKPGTVLKHWLSLVFKVTPNCRCNDRARIMDNRGCDWCAENISTIIGWLQEEAEKRGLPFLRLAASVIISRAIRVARNSTQKAVNQNV